MTTAKYVLIENEAYSPSHPKVLALRREQSPKSVSPDPEPNQFRKWIRDAKPLLNKTESRYCCMLESAGIKVMKQAITLRLDPPYKSYTPDLAYVGQFGLTLVEVKGPHRFRRAGIAKAALAAKTYSQFRFELADWSGSQWKKSTLSP